MGECDAALGSDVAKRHSGPVITGRRRQQRRKRQSGQGRAVAWSRSRPGHWRQLTFMTPMVMSALQLFWFRATCLNLVAADKIGGAHAGNFSVVNVGSGQPDLVQRISDSNTE